MPLFLVTYFSSIRPLITTNHHGAHHYILVLILLMLSPNLWALGEKSWLVPSGHDNLTLVDKQKAIDIVIDSAEFPGVLRAAKNLQTDIEKVTGKRPALKNQINNQRQLVIAGTLGKNKLIEQLIAHQKLEVSNIRNQWDAFQVVIIEKPFADVDRALVIVGANKRGTMYGIYSLSEQIGVSPWY